jgi:hypothetical protein
MMQEKLLWLFSPLFKTTKPMTKAELTAQTVWDDYALGNLSLFIPLFDESIKIVLFPDLDQAPGVTDKMTAIVNDLLQLKQEQMDRVKELLWE